ncbi:hypothetical protein P9112_009278 [Eukaryota sp. TZLM1-RC]
MSQIFSASGAAPLSQVAVTKVRRVYDSDTKGYIFLLEKSSNSSLTYPKPPKTLSLTDRFIALIISACDNAPFSLEFILSDVTRAKRKLILSTVVSKPSITPLHCRLPFPGSYSHTPDPNLSPSLLLNMATYFTLIVDLDSLCEAVFSQSFGHLTSISLRSTCRLRSVYSLRHPPDLPHSPSSWLSCQPLPQCLSSWPLLIYSAHDFTPSSPRITSDVGNQRFEVSGRGVASRQNRGHVASHVMTERKSSGTRHQQRVSPIRERTVVPSIAFGTRVEKESESREQGQKYRSKSALVKESPSVSIPKPQSAHVLTRQSNQKSITSTSVASRYSNQLTTLNQSVSEQSVSDSISLSDICDWNEENVIDVGQKAEDRSLFELSGFKKNFTKDHVADDVSIGQKSEYDSVTETESSVDDYDSHNQDDLIIESDGQSERSDHDESYQDQSDHDQSVSVHDEIADIAVNNSQSDHDQSVSVHDEVADIADNNSQSDHYQSVSVHDEVADIADINSQSDHYQSVDDVSDDFPVHTNLPCPSTPPISLLKEDSNLSLSPESNSINEIAEKEENFDKIEEKRFEIQDFMSESNIYDDLGSLSKLCFDPETNQFYDVS